ncbi:hypothetical protein Y1Q_0001770 [Alligator mississippiensis]|uniref:Uncharacterized protein n=1 Tax=Alligator mississippiensis TaxID=8496 RepID=A0A151MKS4_ALLMI|nr:hypothetical protein Y1Q_0001770 [Alligator mississippiensis]
MVQQKICSGVHDLPRLSTDGDTMDIRLLEALLNHGGSMSIFEKTSTETGPVLPIRTWLLLVFWNNWFLPEKAVQIWAMTAKRIIIMKYTCCVFFYSKHTFN